MVNNNINKLDTKFSTKITMSLARLVCKIWWFGRCKLRKDMNDFDYHIEDLRSIYPNQLVYKTDMGKLPFFSKTLIENSRTEKSSAIKIGDCNITYSFIKPQLGNLAEVHGLFCDPRLEQIDALLTSTYIRHNNPSKFSKKAMMEGESNVVKFTNK